MSAYRLAQARYWLGTNGLPESDRKAALEAGIAAARAAVAINNARPEGHFWLAGNMGALAESFGIQDGDWITVESRRGTCTLQSQVVRTIRPDTVFIPYHWAGSRSVNQLTIAAQDPISKIPEYKVCAVRVRKAERPPDDVGLTASQP